MFSSYRIVGGRNIYTSPPKKGEQQIEKLMKNNAKKANKYENTHTPAPPKEVQKNCPRRVEV